MYIAKIDSLITLYKDRIEVLNLLLQKTNDFSKKVPDNQKYFAVRLVLDYLEKATKSAIIAYEEKGQPLSCPKGYTPDGDNSCTPSQEQGATNQGQPQGNYNRSRPSLRQSDVNYTNTSNNNP